MVIGLKNRRLINFILFNENLFLLFEAFVLNQKVFLSIEEFVVHVYFVKELIWYAKLLGIETVRKQ